MGKSRNNQKNKRVSRKRESRKRKSHKHRAGITQEEHLRELINLKARANNLPTWDYNNEYDPPDFLRLAEIQNSPGNRAKENIWYCLNNCRKYPSSPGCEGNCIQDEIDKVYTPRTKAESLVRKNIYKLKKKVRDKKTKAFNTTRRATRLKNTNPRILKTIKGYM